MHLISDSVSGALTGKTAVFIPLTIISSVNSGDGQTKVVLFIVIST
jgi:hypothetical protein